MNAATKLAGFSVALAALLGGGAIAGSAIDPNRAAPARAQHAGAANPSNEEQDPMPQTTHAGQPAHVATGSEGGHPVRGLAIADDGLRLIVDAPDLTMGAATRVRFRIVDDAGRTVRDFDVEHERWMHVIVARRDLSGFQHLHPTQASDGSWAVSMTLQQAGSYRLFADFSTGETPHTLAGDLRVDGPADLRPLPAPAGRAMSDAGDEVQLETTDLAPGVEAQLRFTIRRDGQPVRTEPYLGAGGHLVALREGDLAFLHVHPTTHAGPTVGFAATFPTAGRYRLFLQFMDQGRLHTVAFTQEV
jgi:hypothetical protein